MADFKLDIDKCIHATLLVLEKLGGKTDFHKVFKILYFADQKHLARYGRPVIFDNYIAMKKGPVPSSFYDILKEIRSRTIYSSDGIQFVDYFNVENAHYVTAKLSADVDYLSETDVECLNDSIRENINLNFFQLTDKSHDEAYNSVLRNCSIPVVNIAKVGGASYVMLQYIKLNIENQRALS